MFLGPTLRELERELQNPVDADPGHHNLLDDGLAVGALEDLASDARVLPFGVLPDDVEVDVPGPRPASGLTTPGMSLTGRRFTY